MNSWALLLLPLLPGLSAAILAVAGRRWSYGVYSTFSTAAAGAAFLCALYLGAASDWGALTLNWTYGAWLTTPAFEAGLSLRLDSLALWMSMLVSGFGFLITFYSVGYMRLDQEQGRFFASLNLFVAAMLLLVLADNLVLIFLGWEGVGLCSYLLIGHYWKQPGVPLAAFRAFFVNRVGDIFFLLGVFMLFTVFGSVSFSELDTAGLLFLEGDPEAMRRAVWGAFLLLGGAFAKSAQAPLHVWLADAMAGPTPVSALIHAATMVTAGIYLVVRLDWLFAIAPEARFLMAVCALVTLIIGALMALTQTDIKKILAYSTLSNLALMFLALSITAVGPALLHLFAHAFFKALLFLAAGSVIIAAHHEQDIRKLRGVLKKLPITNAAFWVGCIGGAGLLPFLSAAFFSKELILESLQQGSVSAFGLTLGPNFLYGTVLVMEWVTVLYLFRLLGYLRADSPAEDSHQAHGEAIHEPGFSLRGILIVLSLAAPIFGILSATPSFGGGGAFYRAVSGEVVPAGPDFGHAAPFLAIALLLAVGCYLVFAKAAWRSAFTAKTAFLRLGDYGPLSRRFYFDDVYEYLLLGPLRILGWLCRIILEFLFVGWVVLFGSIGMGLSRQMKRLQSGRLHHYAMAVLFSAVLLYLFVER